MRRPHAATATAAVVLLFLWLAVLTFAFHGCGSFPGCGSLVAKRNSVSLPRKMLLAVASLDASSSTTDRQQQQRHHHHHHHHHHHQHHRHHAQWNRQGIPPSAAGKGEEIDPRYGVQKRLVPTGPNPLHH